MTLIIKLLSFVFQLWGNLRSALWAKRLEERDQKIEKAADDIKSDKDSVAALTAENSTIAAKAAADVNTELTPEQMVEYWKGHQNK